MPPTLTVREALARAAPVAARRPLLIVSDFDGTLSHTRIDPWAAQIVPGAQRALRRLSAIDGVHVALMSGRVALDLATRARIGGVTYLGNHGAERGSLARGARAETLIVAGPDIEGRF